MREPLGPLSAVDHAALVRLCNLKKVIRRDDGYGTESETLISSADQAARTKAVEEARTDLGRAARALDTLAATLRSPL